MYETRDEITTRKEYDYVTVAPSTEYEVPPASASGKSNHLHFGIFIRCYEEAKNDEDKYQSKSHLAKNLSSAKQ